MRLLVGFDGSDGGHDALELARAIAVEGDETSVLVVTVMPYEPLPANSGPTPPRGLGGLDETVGETLAVRR